MKSVLYILFLFTTIFGYNNSSYNAVQDTISNKANDHLKDQDDFFNELKFSPDSKNSPKNLLFLNGSEMPVELDSLTKRKYLETYSEYLHNIKANYQHSQQVFKWQLFSSKLIFITVVIVVFAGILFSGLQFKKGASESKTELELSKDGFKVSSSILGVIVLVISLAFFYLYLVYVYPIQEIS